jgi:light-regulated signal transduction histidine kinase (bacteriophytochrome)
MHGNSSGRRSSNRDITERKQIEQQLQSLNASLEERVAHRTEDLLRLNQELESFCYSISHELRAPIARLEAFCRVLTECVADGKPDELLHLAERIEVSSVRLKSVIDALLQMNRISRSAIDREQLDLSKMSQQIMNEILENAGNRSIQVTIAPGLVVQGDRTMLGICLQNLLGNAVKFTARTEDAMVEVGMINQSGATVYFVRDNGAGFDMAFAEKLFEPFCRLHAECEFEGNGIGLAMVQRIIERHGGNVWAEAEPGKGATFYFTIGE